VSDFCVKFCVFERVSACNTCSLESAVPPSSPGSTWPTATAQASACSCSRRWSFIRHKFHGVCHKSCTSSNDVSQVQQLLDGPLMRSSHRALFNAWVAFTTANCFVLVERFESALSVLLQYSKMTDSNSVHDSCTVSVMLLM
jgi:hypothetical protein